MTKLLIAFGVMFFSVQVIAQVSDIISVRKRNGTIIKTFSAGSPILLQTRDKTYLQGVVQTIRNDSLLVTVYDIRPVITNLRIIMSDTISRYIVSVHYKDILRIKVFNYRRFVRGKVDKLLMFGGAGYFVVNVINGAYLHQPVTDKQNLGRLGISVGAVGIALLIKKFFAVNRFSRKRHRIVYVRLAGVE